MWMASTSFKVSSSRVRLKAPSYSSSCCTLVCPVMTLPMCHLAATLHTCTPFSER